MLGRFSPVCGLWAGFQTVDFAFMLQIPARDNTLIIFVKQPRLAVVKTRLGSVIGYQAARDVYQILMRRAIGQLARDGRWQTVLAVTPDQASWRWWPEDIPRINQGSGLLGQRMSRCMRRLARPRAILIGSDTPGITPGHIAQAFHRLKSLHFVFGPSEDGGYWLIGWRRSKWPASALRSVRWSSAYALQDSVVSLGKDLQTGMLDPLYDIDTPQDYCRWRAHRSAADPSGAQVSRVCEGLALDRHIF